MLRIVTRLLGLLLVALGFAALIVDGARSLAGGGLYLTSIHRGATELYPAGFAALQAAAARSLPALLWDPLFLWLPLAPISLAFAILGAALILLSHKEELDPKIFLFH